MAAVRATKHTTNFGPHTHERCGSHCTLTLPFSASALGEILEGYLKKIWQPKSKADDKIFLSVRKHRCFGNSAKGSPEFFDIASDLFSKVPRILGLAWVLHFPKD